MNKQLVKMRLADIIPYENNPRHNDNAVEAVKESIRQCEYIAPIIVDEDNVILAGHTRAKALAELGVADADVMVVSGLTDEQKRKYRLLDNKTNELATWDIDKLEIELEDVDFDGFDFGFDIEIEELPTAVVEDEVPETAEPRCKLGDLWQLGNHRLICGDSTEVNVIDRLMGGEIADISITSPPYGASKSAKIRDHYVKGNETKESFYEQHKDRIEEWAELIQSAFDNMIAHSESQFINIQLLADNKRDFISFWDRNIDLFCDVIVWDKKTAPPQMQSNVLNNQFEFVLVFGGNGSRTIPFAEFHGNINNIIVQTTGNNEYSNIHRAVYPVELPLKIMQIANKAHTVLDVFGGTGTTMIACEQLNRKCYMCELDERYCDVIIERWENFTGQNAVLLNE